MNPQWLMLPTMISFFFGGYYITENSAVALIFFLFGIALMILKWKYEHGE